MKFFCLLLLITINTEAYSQDTNCIRKNVPVFYGLNNKQLELWRKDVNGCLGYRVNYINTVGKNKSIIGMPKSLFFILFGKPDISSNTDDVYSYFSGCKCDKKKNHLEDTDFIQVTFSFIDGKLVSVNFSVT